MRIGKKTPIKPTNFQYDTWVKEGSLYLQPPSEINVGALSDAGAGVWNGTSSYLQATYAADFNIFGNSANIVTIDMWVRHDDHAGTETYLGCDGTGANPYWLCYHSDGTGLAWTSGQPQIISITSTNGEITDNLWHHVAFIKNGTTYGIYLDGSQVGYASDSDSGNVAYDMFIGSNGTPGSFFQGNMSEVRLYWGNPFSASPVVGLTDTITVPTSRHTADSSTALLLHFDTQQIADSGEYTGTTPHAITNTAVTLNYTDTKLLMHGNGIVDASVSNNKAITAVGTASAYGNKWGTYGGGFNGSSAYLTVPDSTDWDLFGSNSESWTLDAWIRFSLIDGSHDYFFHHYQDSSNRWIFAYDHADGGIQLGVITGGVLVTNEKAYIFADSNFHHVAWVVIGTGSTKKLAIYVDGNQKTYDEESAILNATGTLFIGATSIPGNFFPGSMDEIRIEKSNAFSAAPNASLSDTITVPTGPHAPTKDTKLLLHFENNVTDSSPTPHTVTNNNMVYGQSKFNSGSLWFDGNSDYFTTPDSADWDVAGASYDDWTVSGWVKQLTLSGQVFYLTQRESASDRWYLMHDVGAGLTFRVVTGGSTVVEVVGGEILDSSWHYFTLAKVGSVYSLYLDGVQTGYVSDTSTDTFAAVLTIGYDGASAYLHGSLSDLRVVKGNVHRAVPMVRPYAHFSLNDSAASTTVDDVGSGNNDGTSSTNTVNLTGLAKCGYDGPLSNKCGKFDGTSSYISTPSDADWNLTGSNSDSWSVELFIKTSDSSANQYLMSQWTDANNLWYFTTNAGVLQFTLKIASVSYYTTGIAAVEINTWHHVAMCKVGSEYGLYVDGVQVGYGKWTQTSTFSDILAIGEYPGGSNYFTGYMDEVRIIQSNPFSAAPLGIPYAHYKMNDNAASTTVTDAGSGANNGTASGNTDTLSAEGKVIGCFDFTRTSSEYVNIDALEADISSDTTGSFSVWLNPDDLTQSFPFAFGDTNLDYYLYVRLKATGYFEVSMSAGGGVWTFTTTTTQVSAGNWYHIVLIQNGTEPAMYVNNVLQTLSYSVSVDKTKWFSYIGANLDNGRIGCAYFSSTQYDYWDGKIDDFRYYQNIALTSGQVAKIYNSGSGTEDVYLDTITVPTAKHTSDSNTKLLLHLGDGDVTDSSGSPHTMTNTAVSFGSFDFNGTDEYVNLDALAADILSDTKGVVSFWLKPGSVTGNQWVFEISDASAIPRLSIFMSGDGVNFDIQQNSSDYVRWSVTSSLTIGVWVHWLWVQDGIAAKIYKNGVDVTPTPSLNGTATAGDWLADTSGIDTGRIGCGSHEGAGNAGFADAVLDDVRYYQNVALTAAEVAKIYNSGSGTEYMGDTITVPTEALTGDDPITSHSFLVDGDAYDDYRLVCRTNQPLAGLNLYLRFNSDSGNNYGWQYFLGENASSSAGRSTAQNHIRLGNGAAAYSNAPRELIEVLMQLKTGYARPVLINAVTSVLGTAVGRMQQTAGVWNNTTANVKTIDVVAATANYLVGGTELTLYKKVNR